MPNSLKSQFGFTMTEAVVVAALTGVALLAGTQVISRSFFDLKRIEVTTNAHGYYSETIKTLNNNKAWRNTFQDAANGDLFQCLGRVPRQIDRCIDFDSTPAGSRDDVNLGFLLNLRSSSNSTFKDFRVPTQGFNTNGIDCVGFNAGAPNENCPFREQVFWRFECADQESATDPFCRNPTVVLSVRLENSSIRMSQINLNRFSETIVKDAQPMHDPVTILCESTNAFFDPVSGHCVLNLNNMNCPAGQFATGISASGLITCSSPLPDCAFRVASSSIDEAGGTALLQVDMVPIAAGGEVISYNTAGSTATGGGTDYTIAPLGSLTFASGVPSEEISVTVNDDAIVEGSETVRVSLGPVTGCNLVGPTTHTLTITDNDSAPEIFFPDQAATRNDGVNDTVTVDVRLSFISAVDVDVEYYIIGGTATGGPAAPGNDYYLVAPQVVSISAGTLVQSFTIQIHQDALVEGVENLIVGLRNPVNGNIRAGEDQFVLSITDSGSVISFENSDSFVDETSPSGDVNVRIVPTPTAPVTVNCSIDNLVSTASGADHNFSPQVLTFNPGDTVQVCNFEPVDDGLGDSGETVVLRVDLVAGPGSIGTPANHTITLTEGGAPTCGFLPLPAGMACCAFSGGFPAIGYSIYDPSTHCCNGGAADAAGSVQPLGGCGAIPFCSNCQFGNGDSRVMDSTHPSNAACNAALAGAGPGMHTCFQCRQVTMTTVWQLWRDTGTFQFCP